MNSEIFWKDGFNGKAKGGLHFRSFELNKFMTRVESDDEEIVGIRFEGNNCEFILNAGERIEV